MYARCTAISRVGAIPFTSFSMITARHSSGPMINAFGSIAVAVVVFSWMCSLGAGANEAATAGAPGKANAAGRIDSGDLSLRLLLTDDEREAGIVAEPAASAMCVPEPEPSHSDPAARRRHRRHHV